MSEEPPEPPPPPIPTLVWVAVAVVLLFGFIVLLRLLHRPELSFISGG